MERVRRPAMAIRAITGTTPAPSLRALTVVLAVVAPVRLQYQLQYLLAPTWTTAPQIEPSLYQHCTQMTANDC